MEHSPWNFDLLISFTRWRHQMETLPRYWPFVRGIHRFPVNYPHKGQWGGARNFSLVCAWINGWVNNGEAGDLNRHRTHYDVTVMILDWMMKILFSVSLTRVFLGNRHFLMPGADGYYMSANETKSHRAYGYITTYLKLWMKTNRRCIATKISYD